MLPSNQTTEDGTMYENGKIYMGLADGARVELALNMCNRHGLIAGASGTGKTITMKVMAESFFRRGRAGVPVRRQGRRRGHLRPRREQRGHGKAHRPLRSARQLCLQGLSRDLLGHLSDRRPRRPRDSERHGA
ncbi:MAG: helicase HerA-like domain-containing protein [Oscillospiraceae bacterium]